MQKIMFSDKYSLTDAVLQGRKTMTRRQADVRWASGDIHDNPVPKYKVGEVLAVAQRYSELSWDKRFYDNLCSMCERLPQYELKGWDNKMFVRADLMPHQIQITNIKVERLQDISDFDIIREGCLEDEGKYFIPTISTPFMTSREAFSTLIEKVSGKGTWESNPWVFAYTFELVK